MSNVQFLITPTGHLVQNGTNSSSTVQFLALSDDTGSILHMFNKFNACFTFDNKRTVTVNLVFSGVESQEIDIKEIGPELFSKVDIYVDLIDDTTADGDLYEHLVTNTAVLEFNSKTLADYNIVDAYTKNEVDSKIPTKVSQLQNDSGYLTQHQDISGKADKTYVDSKIPTKVSQLQNDAGYLTQHQDISGKADKSYVDELIGDIEDELAQV